MYCITESRFGSWGSTESWCGQIEVSQKKKNRPGTEASGRFSSGFDRLSCVIDDDSRQSVLCIRLSVVIIRLSLHWLNLSGVVRLRVEDLIWSRLLLLLLSGVAPWSGIHRSGLLPARLHSGNRL